MNMPGPRIKKIKPSDIDRLMRRIAQIKNTTGADISQIEESILSITARIDDISTITGGNIYIQNTEPSDPDCVWIDTNGIDLIIE